MENILGLSVFLNHSTKINWSFKINIKMINYCQISVP
jgi:hypothetical protein